MNIIEYYQTNLTTIYKRVKKLEGVINAVFMPDDLDTPSLELRPVPTQMLNRSTYLWTLESMEQLQDVVDWLVGAFNGYNLVDITTGEETTSLKLWQPKSLVIDENYRKRLAKDFSDVNKLLDELEKYAEPYLKGVN